MDTINQYLRVQALTYATRDPEALSGFYQQALNIPVAKKRGPDHLGIQLENLYLGFDRIKQKPSPDASGPVIWFWVDNVEEAFMHIVALGAQVRSEVNREQNPGFAQAVLFDPDGNMLGLIGPSVPGGDKPE
jgi:predicted enzyme related to lactoylglutathione lyase